METLFEIFEDTPWFVYLIFLFLVGLGLKATRHRTGTIKKIFIIPLIFMIWNVAWLSERIYGHLALLVYWPLGLTAGFIVGWLSVAGWKVTFNRAKGLITLPPTWSTLILIIIIFAVRYFFIFKYEVHPEEAAHLYLADALISGVLTGIFVGRSSQLLYRYQKAK